MNPVEAVAAYVAEVQRQLATGHAAEHAYRPGLKTLMEQLGEIDAVNDPRRSEHGAPDFVFLQRGSRDLILGWAEAKDITGNLDKTEKSEQLQRYSGYSNLYLTNYVEFRFYANGERYAEVAIGELKDGKFTPRPENYEMLVNLLTGFLGQKPQPITSGVRLAEVMGGMARRIRTAVSFYLGADSESNAELLGIFGMIKELLVHDLDEARFADMYAQTLVYGLFAARYNDESPDSFSRAEARELVPASNPFLRQFFDHIAGANFDWRLARIVDELCEVFSVSDVREIVHRHLAQPQLTGMGEDDRDPIIHFYEDFLKAYDPDQRKRMGAYYTPLPVVRFMVRMVDKILKEDFGLAKGLADTSKTKVKVVRAEKKVEVEMHKVQILDPAVGTATFLNEIVKHIHKGFAGQEGRWPAYAKEDLIPRLHGFELMMAPYTVAHLKLGLTLRETGVEDFGKRLGVYLTNTLEEGHDQPQNLFQVGLAEAVAQEAIQAGEIKNERPIMVVIGNPPYSGISSNETTYANSLIEAYKVEPGGQQKLQERKHWLNDDYVKFIAFAEAMIEKSGSGVVAMITNHGYLDNPTFRGMRWRLSRTFDRIYVLDLHGNAKRQEVAPDGSKDENVFSIQQGVSILVGVREGGGGPRKCVFARADLFGRRTAKFDALNDDRVKWRAIAPKEGAPFTEIDEEGQDTYLSGVSLGSLMSTNVTGLVTARDAVVIDIERDDLIARVEKFKDPSRSDDEVRSWLFPGKKSGKYPPGDSRGWKLPNARRAVSAEDVDSMIRPITYRPFDRRHIYYSPNMVDWPRGGVMPHMYKGSNVGLVSVRRVPDRNSPPYVFATADMVINGTIRSDSVSIDSVFPLYLYADDNTRTPNFAPDELAKLTSNLKTDPTPEQVLDYIYGVLHSPAYREKYKEFLKIDFPRVPVPADDTEFKHFVKYGNQLRELHLMTSPECEQLITKYPVAGSNEVEKPRFENGKVWINGTQHFDGVPEVAWNFYIGGYQPAQKWLKDRKGRTLSNDDIEHYQKIVKVLAKTDELMQEIDRR